MQAPPHSEPALPLRARSTNTAAARQALLWLALAGLVLVQQYYAGWLDAPAIVLGFVPRPLAIQVGVSLAAAAVWWGATRWCWPRDLEAIDREPPGDGGRR